MAPEILRNEAYNMKIDVWGVGVIAHILLCGCVPFDCKTDQEIELAIQKSQPNFGSKAIKQHLSKEAVDFMTKCLSKNPTQRPSACDLLKHRWLSSNIKEKELNPQVAEQFIRNMNAFSKQNIFESKVISIIIHSQTDNQELKNLEKFFKQLDTSNDGYISIEELEQGLAETCGDLTVTKNRSELLEFIDIDGNGLISYSEFLMAAVNKRNLLTQQNIDAVFRAFDTENTGHISLQDLKRVFNASKLGK